MSWRILGIISNAILTIDSLALYQVVVILPSQESIAIASDDTLNVAWEILEVVIF